MVPATVRRRSPPAICLSFKDPDHLVDLGGSVPSPRHVCSSEFHIFEQSSQLASLLRISSRIAH